jgi:hypothetical protein
MMCMLDVVVGYITLVRQMNMSLGAFIYIYVQRNEKIVEWRHDLFSKTSFQPCLSFERLG